MIESRRSLTITRRAICWQCLMFVFTSLTFGQPDVRDMLSYPYPSNLCSVPATGWMAWTFDIQGKRNVYISKDKGKSFEKLTSYDEDTGQPISQLQFSPDGKWLLFIRGAEPGGNWSSADPVNPTSFPKAPSVDLVSINLAANKSTVLASGLATEKPAISPADEMVAFVKDGSVWAAPMDGSEKAKKLFFARGRSGSLAWSPDGGKLAFVSNRGSHSFIGIYQDTLTPVHWVDPAFSSDGAPVWSPKGDSLVFVRRPATGGAPDSILRRKYYPWEIRVAALRSDSSKTIWKSPNTLNGSIPTTQGRYNLHWAAENRIIFLSTMDNWPHLYSISSGGGKPILLTPGDFMVEYISLSPSRNKIIFSANTGDNPLDIDRRHIGIVPVNKADMRILTPGEGIEAFPVFVDANHIAFISSTPVRPALPAVLSTLDQQIVLIGTSLMPPVYDHKNLVKPAQVILTAPDGTPVHAQLFISAAKSESKKPAIVCIHGGPMRQMLLGWNYSDYYAAHYAVNQLLAQKGYVVLSVNYRLGIGYGNAFHHPEDAGRSGASEYQDILAAGQWLARQPYVDKKRIGVYGGSYGGYLTAFALGRNSDVFAAGVDISGVHSVLPRDPYTSRFEHAPDAARADTVAWQSSPIADVKTWKSPVLLIHADDDRNVAFDESIDLLNRLQKQGVDVETLVIPDDTHHWFRFHNLVRVYQATIDFLDRKVANRK